MFEREEMMEGEGRGETKRETARPSPGTAHRPVAWAMAMGGWGLDACHGVVLDGGFCTAKYGKHVLRSNPVTGLEHHVDLRRDPVCLEKSCDLIGWNSNYQWADHPRFKLVLLSGTIAIASFKNLHIDEMDAAFNLVPRLFIYVL